MEGRVFTPSWRATLRSVIHATLRGEGRHDCKLGIDQSVSRAANSLPEGSAEAALLAALTRGADDLPQSRWLDSLVGRWQVDARWQPIPGGTWLHIEGWSENAWILGGRVLEARGFDPAGTETSRTYFAYDARNERYTAFAINVMSTSFCLERGTASTDGSSLDLDGEERYGPTDPLIAYRRTVVIEGPDAHTVSVTYPDVPPGTYGEMHQRHRRAD
jgi:hypothetical protein